MSVINDFVEYPYSKLCDYEGKYNLKDTHDAFLELLLEFDSLCRRKGVQYSLADGTLLGAMRHGDFVPWDDDADVMVTRTEYKKLRNALSETDKIKLMKIHFLDRITTTDMERRGVYIDLFINDDMPQNKVLFEWKKLETCFLRTYFQNDKVRNVRHDHLSKFKKGIHKVASKTSHYFLMVIIGKKDVFELNDKLVEIGNQMPSGIYTRFTSRMFETKRRFNKASYDEGYADVEFRGVKLRAIKNADTFLREMYGDYMKLLPEEKRKPEHPVNMLDSPKRCIKRYN